MMKVRVHEISKDLNLTNKDITDLLKKFEFKAKNHMSTLEENELDIIFEHFTQLHTVESLNEILPDNDKVETPAEEPKKKAEPAKKAEKVIKTSRYVDTRPNAVDLNQIPDEKIENLVPDNIAETTVKKQKIKKGPKGRRPDQNKKNFRKPAEPPKPAKPKEKVKITIPEAISVGDFAQMMKIKAVEVIKKLMPLGIMASISDVIDYDTAFLIADELGFIAEKEVIVTNEEKLIDDSEDKPEDLLPRSPVVVVMGHVDHGKTSLLDAIRGANVTASEAGGITQHIGAYIVNINNKNITFLDTPGHEAFTAMRARGAQVTDIAILVVAADDGIMPQTIEAINHAKAAGVSIIVAINKMDKPGANAEHVKQELTEYELVPEDWGGDTICVPVSAKKGDGIETLLEMVTLVAEMKELKANPNRKASGTVIESRLDKGRGPVATVLVQNGTLNLGDVMVAGTAVGRVRAMIDDHGRRVKIAGPSTPVEITGLSEVPSGGDLFYAVDDEKMARAVVEERKEKIKKESIVNVKVSLDDLFSQIQEGDVKELNIIVKADVQGSVEAVKQSLEKLSNDQVKVKTIHGGVGGVNESDVMLANASNAIIVGFNVRPDTGAVASAEMNGVDIRLYRVIYDAIEEIEAAMKGMLDPEFVEKVIGHAEIRQTFKVSGVGTIAGAYVLDGKISRNCEVRVVRDSIVIHEGMLNSLKRFKDDVKEVSQGYECGMGLEKFNDIKEGDIIECFVMEEVKR